MHQAAGHNDDGTAPTHENRIFQRTPYTTLQDMADGMPQVPRNNVGATSPMYNSIMNQWTTVAYGNVSGNHPHETHQQAAGHTVPIPPQMHMSWGQLGQPSGNNYSSMTQGQKAAANSTQAPTMETQGMAEGQTTITLLVSGAEAACIIGTGGTMKQRIQTETESGIVVSARNKFFPGTALQEVRITGGSLNVQNALHRIVERTHEQELTTNATASVKILVPPESAGVILGMEGTNIQKMQNLSETNMQMTTAPQQTMARQERVLSITGPILSVRRGLHLACHQMWKSDQKEHKGPPTGSRIGTFRQPAAVDHNVQAKSSEQPGAENYGQCEN